MADSKPVPVIRCDGCGRVTPATLGSGLGRPAITEEDRAADLRGEGWRLTAERDTCPSCTQHEGRR